METGCRFEGNTENTELREEGRQGGGFEGQGNTELEEGEPAAASDDRWIHKEVTPSLPHLLTSSP